MRRQLWGVVRVPARAFSTPSQRARAVEYNKTRAEWRSELSNLRKQYAEEHSSQQQLEVEKRAEQIHEQRLAALERLRDKMKASERNRRAQQLKRQEMAQAQAAQKEVDASLRTERRLQRDKRSSKMVEHLVYESSQWLSPENLDDQITDSFFEKPGMVGHFDERSPYWGFYSLVEDPFSEEPPPSLSVSPPGERSREECMQILTHLLMSYSKNYTDFKKMREGLDDLEEALEAVQQIDISSGGSSQQNTPRVRRDRSPLEK